MSTVLSLLADGGFGYGHMGGWGWLAIIAVAVVMAGMAWTMRGTGSNRGDSSEDPIKVLEARYARGELTTEEFQERRRTIEDARS